MATGENIAYPDSVLPNVFSHFFCTNIAYSNLPNRYLNGLYQNILTHIVHTMIQIPIKFLSAHQSRQKLESMMMVGMLQLFASHSWLSARELITREPVYSTGDLSARLSRRIQKPNTAFLQLLLQVNFHWNWFEGLPCTALHKQGLLVCAIVRRQHLTSQHDH